MVVGSGAAGLNAAGCLHRFGQTDIALVTENMNAGTSRNTGSDKQTYYKLTLSGGSFDSVRKWPRLSLTANALTVISPCAKLHCPASRF